MKATELTFGNFFQDSGVVPGRLSFSGDAGTAGGALPDEHARTDDNARTFQQAGRAQEVLPADRARTEDDVGTGAKEGGGMAERLPVAGAFAGLVCLIVCLLTALLRMSEVPLYVRVSEVPLYARVYAGIMNEVPLYIRTGVEGGAEWRRACLLQVRLRDATRLSLMIDRLSVDSLYA